MDSTIANKITRISNEVDAQTNLISQIISALEGKAIEGEVELATPEISIQTNGYITATVTQEAGYVEAGSKTASRQLSTVGAQTITPSTTNQVISKYRYLTGDQTILGDVNLLAANIVKGKTIFGVAGSADASSSAIELPWATEVTTGTVTFNSTTYDPEITHNLSGKPKGFLILRKGAANSTDDKLLYVFGFGYTFYNTSTGGSFLGSTTSRAATTVRDYAGFTANASTFTATVGTNTTTFPANTTYYWIAWR